ncbi:MAG: type VI secretion system tube protein Hcp [Candidatus Eremiobacteraeota bacterium]|nr:type VI secretion system tube protein Hcp [Candidatus Eremiobacteraeota bacterium]
MTARRSQAYIVGAILLLVFAAAQVRAATTPAPTMRPMQMHVVEPQVLGQCPAGTGIVVTPAGVPPFTALSISFEDTTVVSDSVKTISRPSKGRVTIVKLPDASSADLYHALTRSTEWSTVTIVMHEVGGAPHGMIVTLSEATVVAFDTQTMTTQTMTKGKQEKVTFSYRTLTRSTCGT